MTNQTPEKLTPKDSIIGNGWAFPPTFIKSGVNEASMVTGKQDIDQSLEILLSTILGERIMRPDFGADLADLLFENLNSTLLTVIRVRVLEAIRRYEARIIVEGIEFEQIQAEGILYITVNYRLQKVNSRFNYTFPYYLKESDAP